MTVIFAGAELDRPGLGAFCNWTVAWGRGLAATPLGGTLAVSFFEAGLRGEGAIGGTGAPEAGVLAGLRGLGGALSPEGGLGGAMGAANPGGLGRPEVEGGVKPDGGLGGAIGEGAPGAVGGLGGRFTITLSRGVLTDGVPSLRGGRTIRTVSFLGSDMAGWMIES